MKILGISGSLRQDSYSTCILETMKERFGDKGEIEIFPLHDLPLYNQDIDTDEARPESVTRFKKAIGEAHGLVIISPEYNYGMSGVLKNAIDWASRPAYTSVLKDKPVLLVGSSIAFTGAVRALAQLKDVFLAVLARPVPVADIAVANAQDKIKDRRVTDEITLGFLDKGVEALLAEIRMLSLGRSVK